MLEKRLVLLIDSDSPLTYLSSVNSYTYVSSGSIITMGGDATQLISSATPVVASGGALAGGYSPITSTDLRFSATGRTTVSGIAAAGIGRNFESDTSVPITIGSTARVKSNYKYKPNGLSSDAPPNYSGVNVGYSNALNPTIVNYTAFYNYDINWRTDTTIFLDIGINWNTGRDRQYWYRIVGKGRPNGCPPLDVNDPCCMKYIMNVHARSVQDLCSILKERRWKWPILSVQRYSRPAETSEILADEAAGISHDCNRTIDVEICTHELCEDFCVDFDLTDSWGIETQLQRHYAQTGSNGVIMNGQALTSLFINPVAFSYQSTGEITIAGEADTTTSGYGVHPTGVGIVASGTARFRSTTFRFTGGQYPFNTSRNNALTAQTIGPGPVWNLPDRALSNDALFTTCDVSFGQTSQTLVLKDFGFFIPEDLQITGIQVRIDRKSDTAVVRDETVCFIHGGQIVSENKAKLLLNWPVSMGSTSLYGSSIDDWKADGDVWDTTMFNDPDLGIMVRCVGANAFGAVGYINFVDVIVYYEDPVHQQAHTGGNARQRTPYRRHVSSGGPSLDGYAGTQLHGRFVVTGIGDTGPLFSSVTTGGQATPGIHHTAYGGPVVSGVARTKNEHYHYSSEGGELLIEGQSRVVAADYSWNASGGLSLTTEGAYSLLWVTRGGASVGGTAESSVSRFYDMTGPVEMGGEARCKAPKMHWTSTGSITMGGAIGIQTIDIPSQSLGVACSILDYKVNFATDNVVEASPVTGSIDACGCTGLPLLLNFNHNMATSNKFSQFLQLNNITLPRILGMRYNRINEMWQYNAHYKGRALNRMSLETWDMGFNLQCTSLIAGTPIGLTVWKLTMYLREKNLLTEEDFDTKVVIGFLPDAVCASGKDFKFQVSLDTQVADVSIVPVSTIYQTVLYDNIGLFKEPYWIENPNLIITVSQIGLSNPTPRQEVFTTE